MLERLLSTALVLPAVLVGQSEPPASPKFEVVSIREVPSNAPPVERSQDFTPVMPGGQFIDSRANLFFMIAFAWNVRNPAVQMIGLPDWADQKSYAVAAKAGADFPRLSPEENREQVRLMLRTMLADRFRLQLHTEVREGRIFELWVARGGFKFHEVDPPVPPAKEGNVGMALGDDGGRMIGRKSTIAGMTASLALFLKRPVIDKTGLRGYYDFDVKWSAPAPAPSSLGAEGIGLLVSALQNQFGLRVVDAKGPVEHWVVDRVEAPTEN